VVLFVDAKMAALFTVHKSIVFCIACTRRRKESSRSLSHLLMSFLSVFARVDTHIDKQVEKNNICCAYHSWLAY